jgi:hypothetical protein
MRKFTQHATLALLALALAVAGPACQDARITRSRATAFAPSVVGRFEEAAITRQALAEAIRGHLKSEGGCTLDPHSGRPVGAVNAYAVSREGHELRLTELPTVGQIATYLERHEYVLASEPVYVGAWHDDRTGAYYLDLSELLTDRTAAEARGRAQGQQCIYHLASGSEIRLK